MLGAVATFKVLTTAVLVGAFVWAWVETRLSIRIAHQLGLLAPVTHRSAHRVPMPTIGGMAIVDTVLVVALLLNLFGRTPSGSLLHMPGVDARMANWLLILCGAAMGVMGFVDDWRAVAPWPKLAVQVACALPPAWLFRHAPWFGEDTWGWLWGETVFNPHVSVVNATWMWFTFGLNFTWILLVTNIFNFMDGMDGLGGLFAAAVAMTMALTSLLRLGSVEAHLATGELFFTALATAGAALGFLRLNLPPAQTFMGDVGSQFLGWLLATIALMGHVPLPLESAQQLWPVGWAPLLLFLPFLGDGLFTMGRRALRGENIFTPHFTHLYQRLLSRGRTHAEVLAAEALVILGCSVLTLGLIWVSPPLQPLLGLAGLCAMLALWLHVRVVETEGEKGGGEDGGK